MVEDKIIYFSKEEYKNHIRDSLLKKCSFSKSGLMEYLFISENKMNEVGYYSAEDLFNN